ncbi:GNAT family N-acetyltransferase [Salipaludibacillus agaradhaerens]|uniref:GNAT family N-acetyltransferase n=1 Tax=Salipaludibacillus agaradhaerens TaxID=76935 RepID=UPI002150F126|nr:GNAT family N-acetyltransferase [Salipaludibacillus agaradhaerens]MCR6107406.1 GNAT family N-acetyltransferase [Salipaludibacillus agaradhaerens]MCR6119435.1 GNAT family N-acetyltransferase [Salipaludibacillus agaradhaerens]
MVKISRHDFKASSTLLGTAFSNDPLFTYLFGSHSKADITKFFHFVLTYQQIKKQLIIGKKENDLLQGLACVEKPQATKTIKSVLIQIKLFLLILQLAFQVKWKAFKKINHYMKMISARRPAERHHYLVCIGVNHKEQGKGVGKCLLDAIHEIVDHDPLTTGIALDTENEDNIAFYRSFGYQLISEDRLGEIMIYTMFRNKKPVS